MKCRICLWDNNPKTFGAREMMFGIGDEFIYFICSHCGCLQISKYPDNLNKYYRKDYYSYREVNWEEDGLLKRYLRKARFQSVMAGKGLVGRILEYCFKTPLMLECLKICEAKLDWEILDVGCGSGRFLLELYRLGFGNLTGVDPHIERNVKPADGVFLFKKHLADLEGKYDLIFLRDSLEHMPQQSQVFMDVRTHLKSAGFVVISIPILGYCWRRYGMNWVGLDAPRHFYIHTKKSIDILCQEAGFRMVHLRFGSQADQIIGSEQYLRGIPLVDKKSYFVNPKASVFSRQEINAFKRLAKNINQQDNGDRIVICLATE
jgi:SAM-dependent methyltransferase